MPRRVPSLSACTSFMNRAASPGVTLVDAPKPPPGAPHTARSGLVTVLRKMNRCICWVPR
jgi:hypothetical protein